MSFFWLWNPTLTRTGACFEITAGDLATPDRLTDGDVRRCLDLAGLRGTVERAEMLPVRANHFTDYRDSDDWRDRWQEAWLVHVAGAIEPAGTGELRSGLVGFDDMDAASIKMVDDEGPSNVPALFVVGGLGARLETVEQAALDVLATHLPDTRIEHVASRTIPPRPARVVAGFERYAPPPEAPLHLVRCLARGVSFPADVARLDAAVTALEAAGSLVSHDAYDFLARPRTFEPRAAGR